MTDKTIDAWMTDDGRVISARQKKTALKDGGASASSVHPYSIPLTRRLSQPAERGEKAEPVAFGYVQQCVLDSYLQTASALLEVWKTPGGYADVPIYLHTAPPPAAGVPDGFDIERAKTLMGHVIGYCKATELRSLSSDAMQALKELDTMLSATPSSAIDQETTNE